MATSKYRAYIFVKKYDSDYGKFLKDNPTEFSQHIRETPILTINNSRESMPATGAQQFADFVNNEKFPYEVGFTFSINHTCRETLLGELFLELQMLNFYNDQYGVKYRFPMIFIEYFLESGNILEQQRIDLAMNFANNFLRESTFHLQVSEKSLILSFSPSDDYMVFTASLLLWIFRNMDIMSYFTETAQDTKNLRFSYFMRKLSTLFLEHSSWQDEANPGVALSLFCYMIFRGIPSLSINPVLISGPSRLAQQCVQPYLLQDYVEQIIHPLVNQENLKILPGFADCDDNLRIALNRHHSLLKIKALSGKKS